MAAATRSLLGHLLQLTAQAAPDAALLARWVEQKDESAFASLVARHGPMVLGICRRVLGDWQHAEDAFQATFLILARKAGKVRRPEALASFLHGVAQRLARKAHAGMRCRAVLTYPEVPEPADPRPHALDAVSGRELLVLIDREVARLPEMYRMPVLLCVLQERPVAEAARLLGWSTGSVRGRLARGRQRLRERLAGCGLASSGGAIALLAPAEMPRHLIPASLRNLTSIAPASVSALAAGTNVLLGFKILCVVLVAAAIGLGAGLPLLRAPKPPPPLAAVPPALVKDDSRRDIYGDPLPEGAIARLGTLRFRVTGGIQTLALAPDGKILAVSSFGRISLLDAKSGKRIRHLASLHMPENHQRPPGLVISPDGKRLSTEVWLSVSQHHRGVVRVWELTEAREPRDYDADQVVWLGWSADSEPLAICVEKEGLRLRELAAGKSRQFRCADLVRDPGLYESAICTFTPTGQVLALADQDHCVVHVWANAQGRRILYPMGDFVTSLAVSPDGSKLVSATNQSVQAWEPATGKLLYTIASPANYCSCQFSVDGNLLVVENPSAICFFDAATGRERARTRIPYEFLPARIYSSAPNFSLSADGKALAMAERLSVAVQVFDVATGEQKPAPAGHRSRLHGIAFSPDGSRVATGGHDGMIRIWELTTGTCLRSIQRGGMVRDIAFSRDGGSLFSASTDDNLWVCDVTTGQRKRSIRLEDPARPQTTQSAIAMKLSEDGKRLIALSYYYSDKVAGGLVSKEMLLTGWDASTRKQLFHRRLPGLNSWIALSPDGRVLAVPFPSDPTKHEIPRPSGPMHLVDAFTGEPMLVFPAGDGQNWPLTFSPDGRVIACANLDSKRSSAHGLWETATASEVLTLAAGDHHVAFSPNCRLLAHVATNGEIAVWDVARGRKQRQFKGFDSTVTSLAFAPDGRRLVSALDDSTLLVWDIGPREDLASTRLGTDGVAKAWADLAGADAGKAFRARWVLASSPEEGLALLGERLRPATAPDAQLLHRLMADLSNAQFVVRSRAQAELEALGDLAEPALRQALAGNPTLELRQRVQRALDRLRGPVTRPEVLRPLRALAVLEDIGTPAARKLLQALASGAPAARLTREARASLNRLNGRTAVVP